MTRRVLVLALALVTMAAPLALTVCQVLCAGHDAMHASTGAPEAHSCHGDAAPAAVTLTAVPHACGHTSEAPSGLEPWVQAVAAPVAVPISVTLPSPPSAVRLVARAAAIDTSPPGALAHSAQLRV
jgi:hypothetical protein